MELTCSLEYTKAVQEDHSKSLTAIQARVWVSAYRCRAEPDLVVSGIAEVVRGNKLQEQMQHLLQDLTETET